MSKGPQRLVQAVEKLVAGECAREDRTLRAGLRIVELVESARGPGRSG